MKLFHAATLQALAELTAAAGLSHPRQFLPGHIMRRVSEMEVRSFAEIYPAVAPHSLIEGTAGPAYSDYWAGADAASFAFKPRGLSDATLVAA